MPAYVTALVTVTNPQEILTYAEQVDATVAQHGGRFIVKGGPVAEVLEGDHIHARRVRSSQSVLWSSRSPHCSRPSGADLCQPWAECVCPAAGRCR